MSCGNCNETEVLFRTDRYKLLTVSNFFVLYTHFMLNFHIFNFWLGIVYKSSKFKSFLYCKSGIVSMDMNLNNFIIFNYHNAVAYSFKIRSEHKSVFATGFFLNNVFRTVGILDFFFIFRRIICNLKGSCYRFFVRFLCNTVSAENVKHCPVNYNESLTSCVHNSGFLQYRKLFGSSFKSLLCGNAYFIPERLYAS